MILKRLFSINNAVYAIDRQCFLSKQGDHILNVVLSRGERKNSLGKDLVNQLNESINAINSNDQCRVVIIKSNVPDCFCAGADLKERLKMNKDETVEFVNLLKSTFHKISQIKIPTIAVINGVALGGGLELALACDIIIAGKKSKLGLAETKLAIIPAAGGSQRLPRLIGASKAKELIFTGRALNGQEAKEYGIVNHVSLSENDDPNIKAIEIATEIINNGPCAIKQAKQAIDRGMAAQSLDEGLQIEKECYSKLLDTRDRLEGLEAFSQKRSPKYTGN